MGEWAKYALYFLLGGTIVSISTYLGSQGRSFLAAFASTFPAMTGATFILIYLNGGSEHLVTYAKNLLWFVPLAGVCRVHDLRRRTDRVLALNGRLTCPLHGLRRAGEIPGAIEPTSLQEKSQFCTLPTDQVCQ